MDQPDAAVKATTFQDLPTEIRILIWDLSLSRHRLVCVAAGFEGVRALRPFSVKPILANRESYAVTGALCAAMRRRSLADAVPALPGFNPDYDTLFAPRKSASLFPRAARGRDRMGLLRILEALKVPPRSLAVDLLYCLGVDDVSVLLGLEELFVVVGAAAAGAKTKVLRPGGPVEVDCGLWGGGTRTVQDARLKILTEFMGKLGRAAGPESRMPVVRLTLLPRLPCIRDRGALPDGKPLGFHVNGVRLNGRALRGLLAPW